VGTGTLGQQTLEGVDPGAVTVAPLHLDTIGADQGDSQRTDLRLDAGGIQQRTAGHLFDTGGAGAGEAQRPGREGSDVAQRITLEDDPVIAPGDRVRDYSSFGHRPAAVYTWTYQTRYSPRQAYVIQPPRSVLSPLCHPAGLRPRHRLSSAHPGAPGPRAARPFALLDPRPARKCAAFRGAWDRHRRPCPQPGGLEFGPCRARRDPLHA